MAYGGRSLCQSPTFDTVEDVSIRARHAFVFGSLVAVAACASLAHLDDSDPNVSATTPNPDGNGTDGGGNTGTAVGDGSVTTEAGVIITPTTIDFQRTVCGTAQSIKINIQNTTANATTYQLSIPPSDAFAIDGADATGVLKGDLGAHDTAVITLRATSNKPGTVSTDVNVVVGTDSTTLSASLETRGAGLVFNPTPVDFGTVREKAPSADTTVTLQNTGNDAITIDSFGNAPDFGTPSAVTIEAGTSVTQPFHLNAGDAGDPLTEEAMPKTTGEHCGPVPTLTLKGQRINTNVTVSPAQVDLGTPACNSSASGLKQTILISNYSTAATATFTVKPQGNSKFTYSTLTGTIAKATTATVPGTASIDIGVVSIGNTPQDVNETVTVTTVGDSSKDWPVKLHYRVTGAVVTLDQSSVNLDDRTRADIPIKNTGNAEVCVSYRSDNSQVDVYENDEADRLTPNDNSQRLTVAFFNNSDTHNTGKITISPFRCPGASSTPVVCNQMPSLTVNGHP